VSRIRRLKHGVLASVLASVIALTTACGFAGLGEPAPKVTTNTATTGIDTPASVAMVPQTSRISLGDSVQIVATPIRSSNTSVGSFPPTTWAYGPDSVGTISANAGASVWFRSRKLGVATVYALVSGVSGASVVTVVP
jgi:hypothetical protein